MGARVNLPAERIEQIIKSLVDLHGRGVTKIEIFRAAFPAFLSVPDEIVHTCNGFATTRRVIYGLIKEQKVQKSGKRGRQDLYASVPNGSPTTPLPTRGPFFAEPGEKFLALVDSWTRDAIELHKQILALRAELHMSRVKRWWQFWK